MNSQCQPTNNFNLMLRTISVGLLRHTWIADVKSYVGLPLKEDRNRKGEKRIKPCPPEKRYAIEEALKHFEMIK